VACSEQMPYAASKLLRAMVVEKRYLGFAVESGWRQKIVDWNYGARVVVGFAEMCSIAKIVGGWPLGLNPRDCRQRMPQIGWVAQPFQSCVSRKISVAGVVLMARLGASTLEEM